VKTDLKQKDAIFVGMKQNKRLELVLQGNLKILKSVLLKDFTFILANIESWQRSHVFGNL
jgi:hypothetical protein